MSGISQLDPNFVTREAEDGLLWCDIRALGVEGRAFDDSASFYDRLPARAEGIVREPVWRLQQHSAGMCVRFVRDAPRIGVRWQLRFPELAMSHMPSSGVSGVDLYMFQRGRFRWVGIGIPGEFPDNSTELQGSKDGSPRHFLLYLPLYNGVESVHIGVAQDRQVTAAPDWPRGPHKPICFYGTSITQGASAARPGMAYPAIVSRRLNRPTVNLGFSGNGQAEPEVAQLLAELDPALYCLDPLPNLSLEMVDTRIEPFVRTLRAARPDTPILVVENVTPANTLDAEVESGSGDWADKNAKLRAAHERLINDGVENLGFVSGLALLGDDFEGTVDGLHPTDVGFMRLADALSEAIRPWI